MRMTGLGQGLPGWDWLTRAAPHWLHRSAVSLSAHTSASTTQRLAICKARSGHISSLCFPYFHISMPSSGCMLFVQSRLQAGLSAVLCAQCGAERARRVSQEHFSGRPLLSGTVSIGTTGTHAIWDTRSPR